MSQRKARAALLLPVLVVLGAATGLAAQVFPGETPLDDVLQIVVLDRELLAVDARGGSGTRESLRLGETVLEQRARGQVGVAVTNRRLLAVGASSGSWQDADFRKDEVLAGGPQLGERVALIFTNRRILGFDGGSGNLVESRLGPREQVLGHAVAANVAVAVTGRRALGLSPFTGGLFEIPLSLYERFEEVRASGNVATVRTSRRLLTFRAPSGAWGEERLGLGH